MFSTVRACILLCFDVSQLMGDVTDFFFSFETFRLVAPKTCHFDQKICHTILLTKPHNFVCLALALSTPGRWVWNPHYTYTVYKHANISVQKSRITTLKFVCMRAREICVCGCAYVRTGLSGDIVGSGVDGRMPGVKI